MAYITPFREQNVKVVIGTNLPCNLPAQTAYCSQLEANRGPLAALLKAAVGKEINGVFIFPPIP